MVSPCLIIARTSKSEPFRGFKCRSEGYLDGVGHILREHYNDVQSIDSLMSEYKYGCSSLPAPHNLSFYNKSIFQSATKGEIGGEAALGNLYENVYEVLNLHSYVYLFDVDENEWLVCTESYSAKEEFFQELDYDITEEDLLLWLKNHSFLLETFR